MSAKESAHVKSAPRGGKSFGICKKCGKQFKLKRITKHCSAKVLTGVICSACGTPKKPESKRDEKTL
jgi:hypothetical protein